MKEGKEIDRSFNIVLIEDNPADQELIRRFIEQSVLQVHLTILEDGEAALNYLLKNKGNSILASASPDLILLDLNLPKIAGDELLMHIRCHSRYTNTPVVVISTSSTQEEIRRIYRYCGNSYIVKPSGYKEYEEMLKCLFNYWFKVSSIPLSATKH